MKRETMEQIDALLTGTITEDDFAELQQEMREDPAVLQHYCQQSEVHGRLEWELSKPVQQSAPPNVVRLPDLSESERFAKRMSALGIAAVLTLSLLLAWLINQRGRPDPGLAKTPSAAPASPSEVAVLEALIEGPVARLTKSLDAVWERTAPSEGSLLDPGDLQLSFGVAEIVFDSGARVILRGPAELELISPFCANLRTGTATVQIPSQAVGFRLETPSSSFSEQDTSFVVTVADDGMTDIHAIKGLVEATPKAHPDLALILEKQESLRFNPSDDQISETIRHADDSIDLTLPQAPASVPARYLHWPFDEFEADLTPETGKHDSDSFPAVALAKPRTSYQASVHHIDGKFGRAIQLNGRGAFLSSGFPGIAGSAARTAAFWVRIPPDTSHEQAYAMISWGTVSAVGEKWQVSWNRSGEGVKGAIRTEFGGGYVVGSTDLRDGRWHHVATVFLGGESEEVAHRIRHYVDGRLERITAFKRAPIKTTLTTKNAQPISFGRRLENDYPKKAFKGALDEMYLFPAALTPKQIELLYESNTPPEMFVPTSPTLKFPGE